MDRILTVTYYNHSGFSVAIADVLLIFDYWLGEHGELPEGQRIHADFLEQFREVYVFISHEHPDHLDPVVFEWRKMVPVTYVVSGDMPIGTRGKRMNPGSQLTLSDKVSVKAFDSTDLGVSFLVQVEDICIFHAGDLNFWHWREESTVREIEEAEEAFHQAVDPIMKEKVDLAFFPVDPRQGQMFDAGANYFIMSVKPRLLIPMHFWGRNEIAEEFARRSRCRQTEVMAMTHAGDRLKLVFDDEDFLTIHVLTQVDAPVEDHVDLQSYEGHDPFNDTDLPVKMDE